MEDNSKQEVTGREIPLQGTQWGQEAERERGDFPKRREEEVQKSWKTKLQKWTDGTGLGGQRKR